MKKIITSLSLTLLMLVYTSTANSQVLISLLLGDKLNTGKIEFGLDGGINWLNMSNTPNSKYLFNWNLGFYFDIKLKNDFFIHTGVIVKSKMGTSNLSPYPIGAADLDSAFVGGNVDRKINYFNVPVLLRYRFVDYVHAEAGIMLGLRYTAFDIFNQEFDKNTLTYNNSIKDSLTRLDAGGMVGIGYKLQKVIGMTLSARYYFRFVDVNKVLDGSQKNSSIYLCASIPIGQKKAEKERAEKAAEHQKTK